MKGTVIERTQKWCCGAEEYMDTLVPAVWVEVPCKKETVNVLIADDSHDVGDVINVSKLRVLLSKLTKDL